MRKKCKDCKWFSPNKAHDGKTYSLAQCRAPLLVRLLAYDATLHESDEEACPEECPLFNLKQKVKEATNVQDED